jgi:hypothetical protein
MTSRGAAQRNWSATQPEQDAGPLEAQPEPAAGQAELYAAMGKVNIQALWTQAADLTPAQPAPAPCRGCGGGTPCWPSRPTPGRRSLWAAAANGAPRAEGRLGDRGVAA